MRLPQLLLMRKERGGFRLVATLPPSLKERDMEGRREEREVGNRGSCAVFRRHVTHIEGDNSSILRATPNEPAFYALFGYKVASWSTWAQNANYRRTAITIATAQTSHLTPSPTPLQMRSPLFGIFRGTRKLSH
ncbi:hypothetical protein R5R35_013500 [Gryllus longicercus]|uniref:Uncharacterized protein n=1 Tax=Gryllus longicercus TaxID=2509291 RepID=A0AAN9YW07_9ORTH